MLFETTSVWKDESYNFERDSTFFKIGGECSVVGKEDCSEKLIVAWMRTPGRICEQVNTEDDDIAVKIGLFDMKTTEINVIFESSEQLTVINCTVDSNLKTLVMICETVPSYSFGFTDSSQSASTAEVTYSCYWTPLKSSLAENEFVSLLPLNKESDQMMKVQLLSSTQLLILNPREESPKAPSQKTKSSRKHF
ncbi:hypothetical protein CHUAL_014225 [Chamberlinius hualienensis]